MLVETLLKAILAASQCIPSDARFSVLVPIDFAAAISNLSRVFSTCATSTLTAETSLVSSNYFSGINFDRRPGPFRKDPLLLFGSVECVVDAIDTDGAHPADRMHAMNSLVIRRDI